MVPPSAKEREAWARLPFNEAEYTEKEMGARELVGEPEIPLFERLWARPTFEVHGIRGGFTGEGAKTVIPARAVAKVSTRLVADQRPEEAAAQLQAAVRAACPKGVTAEFKPHSQRRPVAGESGQPLHRAPRPKPWSRSSARRRSTSAPAARSRSWARSTATWGFPS